MCWNCRLQIADCRLQIGDCRLQIADCRLLRACGGLLPLLVAAIAVVLLGAGGAAAADAGRWPAMEITRDFRGPGFYLSLWKILACWFIFLAWVYSTDWVSRDSQEMLGREYLRWNPIVFGTFIAAMLLLWLIPYFWLGLPLLVIAYAAPLVTYVLYRNAKVDNNQRVFTKEHLRYWFSVRLGKVGIKIEAEAPDPHTKGPPVNVRGRGGADRHEDQARTLAARQAPGLRTAREIIAGGLAYRASAIMLDYAQQGVAVRYMVDGVWLGREAIERETADPALEALKILANLNPQDRQGRQEGTFAAEYENIDYSGTLISQGTKTGERVLMQFEDEKVRMKTLDEIGMRPKMQEQLKELLGLKKGLLLFSAMPAAGLRTTVDIALHQTDRLMREFMAVEEQGHRFEEVENIAVTTYNAAEGQSPADVLPKIFRMEPNVVVIRELVNAETVSLLCEAVEEDRLFISTMRAKDSAEALLRVLALGAPPAEFAKLPSAVLSQRLVRKLCDKCKEAYAPTPQILQQLGIPEGRVRAFYRPPQQPEEVCPECNGIGYKGRTAVFELLSVGDNVRKVIAAGAKLDLLRAAGRKDGMRSLQEEGILLVAKGVTSLPELMRVLKQ